MFKKKLVCVVTSNGKLQNIIPAKSNNDTAMAIGILLVDPFQYQPNCFTSAA